MTLLYTDPCFLEHQTGIHPERPQRLEQVVRHLERVGLDAQCTRPTCPPITDEQLSRIHSLEYARHLAAFAASGGGRIEADTVMSSASEEVARRAAGAVCDAVRRVLAGEDATALCLVRPPGHHALYDGAMGFCLYNNVALGAKAAIAEFGLDRVLIVDWDVHHGNGTQDAFWRDEQVGFLSIHRWPFYPGTGSAHETGAGPGLGTVLNLPIEYGTPLDQYHQQFADGLLRMAERMRPQLILISAGFDAHRDDPIGSLDLEIDDFAELTQRVLEAAQTHAGGRVVSVLEGGYNPGILAGCIETHLRALLK